jgi:hypothetical protein
MVWIMRRNPPIVCTDLVFHSCCFLCVANELYKRVNCFLMLYSTGIDLGESQLLLTNACHFCHFFVFVILIQINGKL